MIVVDLEMSGLDSRKCGIVEIGAIELENPRNTFNQHARLNDDDLVLDDPHSYKPIHEILGKTENELRDPKLQTESELLENFFKWVNEIEEKVFVAQNLLDLDYLMEKAKKYNLPKVHYRYIDLQTVAQTKYFQVNESFLLNPNGWSMMSLKNIAKFCGLKDERDTHTGIEDARFEAEMLNRLLKGEKLLPEYNNFEIPEYLEQ